jgi:hypothetical protein
LSLSGYLQSDLPILVFKRPQPFSQTFDPGFKFRLLNKAFGIAVNQPGNPLANLGQLGLSGHQVLILGVGCLQATLIFLGQSLGIFQQGTNLVPNPLI